MPLINLHTHHFTGSEEIFELVNQYPLEFDEKVPYYSIGIHPWRVSEATLEAELAIIENKLTQNNCLALGECGLDKRVEVPFDLQLETFRRQLQLAQQYSKPVVIHCVAGFQEVIELRKKLNITVPLIIHGFSKSLELAKQLLDNGFYVSFGKYLLRNPELETVFQSVPEDRFFLETDTIDEGIAAVYDLAAQYRHINIDNLKKIVERNFKAVFKVEFE